MFTIWSAVNRVSRSSSIIGEAEREAPHQAVQAKISNATYESLSKVFEADLKAGKVADFVALDQNSLTIDSIKIKDIRVMKTINERMWIRKRGG